MKHAALAAVVGVLLIGCAPDIPNPNLAVTAYALRNATPATSPAPLDMNVQVVDVGDTVTLRCRLTNVSTRPLSMDYSTLPWETMQQMSISAITTTGRVLRAQHRLNQLIAEPPPVVEILPGMSIEGDISLSGIYAFDGLPRTEDILVLWAHPIGDEVKTGVVLIPKRN